MKKIFLSIIMAAVMLTGCGGGHHVAYRPIAYGENNQCYYVNNPVETIALQQAGLCQPGWAPTIMPIYWHQRYWNYYASPSYYRTYVPVASRSTYVASEKSWGSTNKTAIATEAKRATYQGSNGKTVTADKIGAAKYGGGARFGPTGTKFGGGSARTGESPAAPKVSPTPAPKASPSKPASPAPKASPSKPASPSKSYGGGSRSYSGGGTKSYSGGGSKSYSGGGSKSYGGGGGRR